MPDVSPSNGAIYPPNSLRVASSLQQLANIYRHLEDYAAARPLLEQVLIIRERDRGSSHPGVAATLLHLAAVLERTGEFSGAKRSYERALIRKGGTGRRSV